MSARTTVYVLVVTEKKEWREIQAVTLADACADAHQEWDDVARVEDASYDKPEENR